MPKPAIPSTIDPALMAQMGLRIEGPGATDSGGLAGRYWWSWTRDGWIGIECGADHPTWTAAAQDAWQTLWADPDCLPELMSALARSPGARP
jgi:hypothetical protein